MELFAAVIHMLECPLGTNTSIILQEDYKKKERTVIIGNC